MLLLPITLALKQPAVELSVVCLGDVEYGAGLERLIVMEVSD
jgi:hypothetical protein